MKKIGVIDKVYRYPVKSMAGEKLSEAQISFAGLVGDRVWAFVDKQKHVSRDRFPWHTAREQEDLLLYKPRFVSPPPIDQIASDEDAFRVIVETPDDTVHDLASSEFLEYLRQETKADLFLRFSEKGMLDTRPVSLFAASTLEKISEESGFDSALALDARRFRANLYVTWENNAPFFEDQLVGQELSIGDKLRLQVVERDKRCKIICLDPITAEIQSEVLTAIRSKHDKCAGVYAAVLREGLVRTGDPIYLEKPSSWARFERISESNTPA